MMGNKVLNPPAINVKLSNLLDQIRKKDVQLKGIEPLLEREINVGFSGGERKLSELVQVISLDPELIILDELDAIGRWFYYYCYT